CGGRDGGEGRARRGVARAFVSRRRGAGERPGDRRHRDRHRRGYRLFRSGAAGGRAMTVNPSGWRPSAPANEEGETQTVTGNRALMLEEPLLFEIGSTEQTGVDFA